MILSDIWCRYIATNTNRAPENMVERLFSPPVQFLPIKSYRIWISKALRQTHSCDPRTNMSFFIYVLLRYPTNETQRLTTGSTRYKVMLHCFISGVLRSNFTYITVYILLPINYLLYWILIKAIIPLTDFLFIIYYLKFKSKVVEICERYVVPREKHTF